MWKETLRIGVDCIDEQHKELFKKTEELLKEIQGSGADRKQKCAATVLFLKDYAVKHFADEEAYQKSIGYKDFAAHKKLHDAFRITVLDYERKIVKSDFDEKDIKEFTGMLIAWLLYHIADADQKIGKAARLINLPRKYGAIVCDSVCNTLSRLVGDGGQTVEIIETPDEGFADALIVEAVITGGIEGAITFIYPPAFVKNLIYSMMNYTPEHIGELEMSVLIEASHFVSGMICGQISKEKGLLCDIQPPHSIQKPGIQPDEKISLDTGKGIIEVDMAITYA